MTNHRGWGWGWVGVDSSQEGVDPWRVQNPVFKVRVLSESLQVSNEWNIIWGFTPVDSSISTKLTITCIYEISIILLFL